MPHFYFHLRNGSDLERDTCGLEFANLEDAYLEAFRAATEIWAELLSRRRDLTRLAFEIADQSGKLVMCLPFAEVLETTRPRKLPVSHTGKKTLQEHVQRMNGLRVDITQEIESAQQSMRQSQELLARVRAGKLGNTACWGA
jgi:hypothetical protein